jgi:sugar phosphate isomerase/epimerase
MKNKIFCALVLLACALTTTNLTAQSKKSTYKIGLIDLMLLKRQKPGALQLTKDLGADGLEVDMGGLGQRESFDNTLANDTIRQMYLDKIKELNIEICALSMSGFYAQSFAHKPTAVKAVADCIATMKKMNVKIGFLPLGTNSDLTEHPEVRDTIVQRLKEVAKIAEKEKVIIAIETSVSAADQVKLLKDIGSPAIKISYNFQNAYQRGRDLATELQTLGAKNIAQIHCTNKDSVWLQNDPQVDLAATKKVLDKMKWKGWLIIERSRDAKQARNVKFNYGANVAYVKSIFEQG